MVMTSGRELSAIGCVPLVFMVAPFVLAFSIPAALVHGICEKLMLDQIIIICGFTIYLDYGTIHAGGAKLR
jgi:hypothetical protein